MSFTNINDVKSNDTRSFVMIYNFNAKEVTNLKNICRVFGIKEVDCYLLQEPRYELIYRKCKSGWNRFFDKW
jgi:hypothetical protein